MLRSHALQKRSLPLKPALCILLHNLLKHGCVVDIFPSLLKDTPKVTRILTFIPLLSDFTTSLLHYGKTFSPSISKNVNFR